MRYLLILCLIIVPIIVSCKPRTSNLTSSKYPLNQDTIWTRTYGGAYEDEAKAIQLTQDGGFIIAGFTKSFGGHDIYLVKTDADGKAEWSRAYGTPEKSEANSVCQAQDGGYAIGGFINVLDRQNMCLIKTNHVGDTMWTRTYGDGGLGEAYAIFLTPDGGFLLAGNIAKKGSIGMYPCIVRTDSMGRELWKEFPWWYSEAWIHCAQQTDDGGYIIGAGEFLQTDGCNNALIIRLNSNGKKMWVCKLAPTEFSTFGRSRTGLNSVSSICRVSDGGFVAATSSTEIVRINRVGDTLWTRKTGFNLWDICTLSGDSLIASTSIEPRNIAVVKVAPDGKVFNTRTFGGKGDDFACAMCKTADGNLVIVGCTNSFGAGDKDFYLVKIRI